MNIGVLPTNQNLSCVYCLLFLVDVWIQQLMLLSTFDAHSPTTAAGANVRSERACSGGRRFPQCLCPLCISGTLPDQAFVTLWIEYNTCGLSNSSDEANESVSSLRSQNQPVVCARIVVEMGSGLANRVPVQSQNSFLDQRSQSHCVL